MGAGIRHDFVSAISDGGDTSLVRPSDWNAEHLLGTAEVKFEAHTSFPGSPTADDLCYRTDRNLLYYYDGTRWLTVNEYTQYVQTTENQSASPHNSTGSALESPRYQVYAHKIVASTIVLTTNTGANYWTVQYKTKSAPNTDTNFGSTFNTSADTVTTFTTHIITIDATVATTEQTFYMTATKTGSPGNLYVHSFLVYRLVG